MPELPEVETIRRSLRPALLGQRIAAAGVLWGRTLAAPEAGAFCARLPGQAVVELGRRGKFLIVRLSRETLLVHLRMSGDLLVEPPGAPPAPHLRLWIEFEGGQRLAFVDPRKFGRVWLTPDPDAVLAGLGPEPLDDEFTPAQLHARLAAARRQLKPLLLDQSFIAGLGNIYTDEALHLARLHPLMRSHQVDESQAGRLWQAIRSVLEEGIRRNGASIDWVYRGGDFQNYFRAYQRTGQPCPACGATIERLVVGQRGTHICPACQVQP
ncbi:MAG: bifunctional DNA-formamidopyrimidine glycosylase/DNA-(apurinic or apyrimidinic site) lyase [Chloroflexota bacterium]